MYKRLGTLFFFVALAFIMGMPKNAYAAVSFELVPPTGSLSSGQQVTFTVNIDTGGAAVTTIQSGLTYVSTVLQYISSQPGPAMDGVQVDTTLGNDKLLFTGTKAAGFTGKDVFATVVFQIIATAPGQTELCTLWQPETTLAPTSPPSAVCNGVCTTSADCPSTLYCAIPQGQTTGYCRMQTCPDQISCSCPVPTSPLVVPTALPTTGFDIPKNIGTIAGISLITVAAGIFLYSKKNMYSSPSNRTKRKKNHH